MGTFSYDRGYTIIEVLIVLLIFGIVTAGVSVAFIQGQREYVIREETVRMQQQARLAMAALERDLRMTGYGFTELGNLRIKFYNGGVSTVTNNYYPVVEANQFTIPSVVTPAPDTDSITIRYYDRPTDAEQDITISGTFPPSSSNTPVSSTDGLSVGDLIIIYDPNDYTKHASILEITGFDHAGGLSTRHDRSGSTSKLYNPPNPGTDLFPPGGYPVGSRVMRLSTTDLRTIRFYVDRNLNLHRQVQGGLTGVVEDHLVASGIEDLQIKYQFRDGTWRDGPISGDPNYDIDNLRALRVSIIARTARSDPRYGDPQPYQLTGNNGNGVVRSGGGHRRMVMSTIIHLRNLAIRG